MLTEFRSKAAKFITDNSPAILTALGAAGTVSTAVLTGRASFKAAKIIMEEDLELQLTPGEEPMDWKEKVRLVWPLYIPPVVSACLSITTIILANRVSDRRAAAMAAAYSISEKAFHEYKEKVYEKFGENKERQVRDEIAQDRVNRKPYSDSDVIITDNSKQLFMDAYSGRYFMSSVDVIRKAENEINYHLIHHVFASLSDFYEKIGLPPTPLSDDVGWHSNRLVELQFSATISDDERACLVLDFSVAPVRGYENLH